VKSKTLSFVWLAVLACGLFLLVPLPARAQEGELQVVDEVIAQVNDDVITLSTLKREMKEQVEALKQNGMPDQQATEAVSKRQPELIAMLVNEQLLMSKGKELDLAGEVEAEVNRRMLDVAKEQGISSMEKLEEAMRQNGLDPTATRQTLRTEIMKQMVIQREVDSKTFFGLSMDELKKYFELNRAKFRKPESVTISEIYLSLAGKNEADVKARAEQLAAQLRAGASFAALAAANSEREINGVRAAPENKGKVGTFEVPNLREDIAAAIKSVKVGGISDPLKTADGYQVLRVDERTAGSDASVFNEQKVREAITIERSPKERETYLQNLRNEAYIKIADNYRTAVEPLLKLSTPATAAKTDSSAAKNSSKKKGDKSKKP
jgi:peptidyl-prolyl cis-trans isomerase SurA